MNLANLDRLIAAVETMHPKRLFMPQYYEGGHVSLAKIPAWRRSPDPWACGTAACLAGWCQILGARTPDEIEMDAFPFGKMWLDLDEDEARNLFLGKWSENDLDHITFGEVLAHLRTLRVIHQPAVDGAREGRDDTRVECHALLDEHVRRYGKVFHELAR